MNELTTSVKFSQRQVCLLQDGIAANLAPVELQYEHFFADGVYGRVMKAPAGTYVVGKPHRTEHLCVLLKGALSVTSDDGTVVTLCAPAVFVAHAGQKKAAFVLEDMEFMNVHPVQTTDLDEIEQQVIIPEREFREALLLSEQQAQRAISQAEEAAMNSLAEKI